MKPFLPFSALLLLLVAGCSKAPPPPYDSDANRLLLASLQAMQTESLDDAIGNLERLQALRPEYALPHVLLQQSYETEAITAATRHLADGEGDLERAVDEIEGAMIELGATPRIEAERNRLQALSQVLAYRTAGPYHDSSDWNTALLTLPAPEELGADADLYREWIRSERRELVALEDIEKRRQVDSIIRDIDRAILLASWTDLAAAIVTLHQLDPQHPVALAESATSLSFYGKATTENEIALFLMFQNGDPARRTAIAELMVPRLPRSATGRRLRVMSAFQQGYLLSAVIGLDKLVSLHPEANIAGLRRRLDAAIAEPQNAPWPSLRGILTPIYRLQEYP